MALHGYIVPDNIVPGYLLSSAWIPGAQLSSTCSRIPLFWTTNILFFISSVPNSTYSTLPLCYTAGSIWYIAQLVKAKQNKSLGVMCSTIH
jgi:hypothetical protein